MEEGMEGAGFKNILRDYNNKNKALLLMQEQQGFCQSELQLVQIDALTPDKVLLPKSSPTSTTSNFKKPSLKLLPQPQKPTPTNPFLNSNLKTHLQQQFLNQHHKTIIYQKGKSSQHNNIQIQFDSEYQNGNLQYVLSEDMCTFDLYMQPDSNTCGHFQWFCFKIRNRGVCTRRFRIMNFFKGKMMYRYGLRPFYKSVKKNMNNCMQLQTQCSFTKNQEQDGFYMLNFDYTFEHPEDQVEFSSQPPYSYTRYKKMYLMSPFTRTFIGKTVLGHPIQAFLLNQNKNYKAVAVIFARQHPGETVGSWMLQGLMQKLTETVQSQILWILVPMVNIDGVVTGNNRTGILGYDFNRHWYIDKDANRSILFPELIGLLKYFKNRNRQFSRKIKIFIDFHGHSSQPNVFAYGPPHHKNSQYYELCRLFPFLIERKNMDFSYRQSSYKITQAKRHCARAVFYQRFGYHFSYTIQSSFGIYRGRKINEIDMMKIGASIGMTAIQFVRLVSNSQRQRVKQSIKHLFGLMRNNMIGQQIEDDSDSDDDGNFFRSQFQNNVVKMIKEAKKDELGSFVPLPSMQTLPSKPVSQLKKSQIQYQNNKLKPSIVKFKFRTEQSQKQQRRQSSLILPRLGKKNTKSRYQKTEASSVLDVSFSNMSLEEIRDKLYHIRNSKLGRKLLMKEMF